MNDTVLEILNLQVQFVTEDQTVIAVDDIDIQLKRGHTLGIVGESGSGKSVTSLAIMGLIPIREKSAIAKFTFTLTLGKILLICNSLVKKNGAYIGVVKFR